MVLLLMLLFRVCTVREYKLCDRVSVRALPFRGVGFRMRSWVGPDFRPGPFWIGSV